MDANKHSGSRGDNFKFLITHLLKMGNLKSSYIDILTSGENMKEYGIAFTAESYDPYNNYERYEQKGDSSANKFLVDYMYRRFPQLNCTKGVKVVARLKINYGSKQTFSDIAEKKGFWPFISAAIDNYDEKNKLKTRNKHKKDLLEDSFEAFIGCTEHLLDNHFSRPGVGYGIVYDIMANIFDTLYPNVSLRYTDLFDAKTRLKEVFDTYKTVLTDMRFIEKMEDNLTISTVYATINGKQLPIGSSKPMMKKTEAQQVASQLGIDYLRSRSYFKDIPEEYEYFLSCGP